MDRNGIIVGIISGLQFLEGVCLFSLVFTFIILLFQVITLLILIFFIVIPEDRAEKYGHIVDIRRHAKWIHRITRNFFSNAHSESKLINGDANS